MTHYGTSWNIVEILYKSISFYDFFLKVLIWKKKNMLKLSVNGPTMSCSLYWALHPVGQWQGQEGLYPAGRGEHSHTVLEAHMSRSVAVDPAGIQRNIEF